MGLVSCLLTGSNGFMGFYGFPGMFYRMDPTYSLVIIGAVICMIASANVNRAFRKYSRYGSKRGITGAQAAQQILNDAGIYDVQIRHISGDLTDNYNPGNKTLNLSDSDKDDVFDVVFVDSYETMVVSSATDERIVGKVADDDNFGDTKALTIKLDDSEDRTISVTKAGNEIRLRNLKKNDVATIRR